MNKKTRIEAINDEELTFKLSKVVINILFALVVVFILLSLNDLYELFNRGEDVSFLIYTYLSITTLLFISILAKVTEVALGTVYKRHRQNLREINKKYS